MIRTLHKSCPALALLLSVVSLSICLDVSADTWVVTDHSHPVTNATKDARIILLDEPKHLQKQLTKQLPKDLTHAASSIQTYLSTPAGRELQNSLLKAQQDVADAWSLGISKVPAVVVDRRYVVYGEPDITAALKMIDRHRSAQR